MDNKKKINMKFHADKDRINQKYCWYNPDHMDLLWDRYVKIACTNERDWKLDKDMLPELREIKEVILYLKHFSERLYHILDCISKFKIDFHDLYKIVYIVFWRRYSSYKIRCVPIYNMGGRKCY